MTNVQSKTKNKNSTPTPTVEVNKDILTPKDTVKMLLKSKHAQITSEENLTKLRQASNSYVVLANWISKGNTLKPIEVEWDNDFIFNCFTYFKTIMGAIGEVTNVVPTIELFCMFMNWNTALYERLINNEVYQESMFIINDYLLDANLSSGQLGFATTQLTKLRVQGAGEHGFKQVQQKDEVGKDNKVGAGLTKEQMLEQIATLNNIKITNDNELI